MLTVNSPAAIGKVLYNLHTEHTEIVSPRGQTAFFSLLLGSPYPDKENGGLVTQDYY